MAFVIARYLHSFAMSGMPVLRNALITTWMLGVQKQQTSTNIILGTCLAAIRNLLAPPAQGHLNGYHKYPTYHASLKNALLLAHRITAGKFINI